MQSLLLRNGLVIDTEPTPTAHHNCDVLLTDGRIAAVGPNLATPPGTTVLDATDRIVLPGLVDTHRHVWQAVLRSIAVDVDLPVYFTMVRQQIGPRFRPADVRAANLLGALECLDGGVTTVQDFAYARADRITPDGYVAGESDFDYAEAAFDGLRSAGIRAVFGHLLTPEDTAAVRRTQAMFDAGNPRLTLAAASLGPSNQQVDAIRADWRLAEELGLPIVTHVASGPVHDRPIEVLRDNGLLHSRILYVHGNSLADDELAMIGDSGGAVSITPAVEARLGHGGPLIGRLAAAGVTTGLGVDVVTTVGGDMFGVLRAGLLTSYLTPGPHLTPADLLRMATLDGAVALGLGDQVGSLRVGKQADLILLRADDLNLACAHDPIGAVVSSAHAGNVDTVLVAGEVVKRNGRLVGHDLSEVRARGAETAEYVTREAVVAAG
ncbi:amidohydrolase family protein [Micromonospora rifamycinica]|uniref:Cytosine/adenosine deaminase n=1 Tax=Micromonospora rifamycinica TaxID=291594 RepID=A0A1C5HM94_9ACTN|nr:amidohydrolase family protein [Micromonospora rifamycinica]SCG47126.1 Cytosine/adenosine deaminase [Micromonospora rifamycinica]